MKKTTRKELGEMLTTGRVIQERYTPIFEWEDKVGNNNFDLDNIEYRLKPKITYYQVNLNTMKVFKRDKPFPEVGITRLKHRFQIEE